MDTEYEVKTDFFKLAADHLGQWVALHPDTREIVTVAPTGIEAFRRAIELGVEGPVVLRVANDYGAYVPHGR